MFAGIKFIPRDQLQQDSNSNGSEEAKESSQKHERRRKKIRRDRSDDGEEGMKRWKKRSKKRYSSDDNASSASPESGSESESLSNGEEERRSRRRRREGSSEDSFSSKADEKRSGRRRKQGKESREKRDKDDERDLLPQKDNILSRKDMGLEWMLSSGSKDNNHELIQGEPKPQAEEVKPSEEMNRTNPKELNPYLKDNDSGYPDDASPSEAGNQLLSSSVVGDGGVSWRLKALKRAKEQAAREGRKLDDVVEERWDSLGQLAASVAARRAAPSNAHSHSIKDRRRGQPEMRKPKQNNLSWKNISSEDNSLISAAISGLNKFADDGSFMDNIIRRQRVGGGPSDSSPHASVEANDHREAELDASTIGKSSETCTARSANHLAAKVLQLHLKGKHEEADKLSKEMEAIVEKQHTETTTIRRETEKSTSRYIGRLISSEQKKREEDADLHLAKKITQNRQHSMSGRADDEYDFDDAPSRKRHRKREGMPDEKRSIPTRFLTQQERCQFCFENPSRPKHLVISIANFTYMMLPQWQPVVQGHCCILPMQHDSATRTVDKNVSEELRNFKKCLLKMFARQDKDVLFLETVIGLVKQHRHCLIECIPVPYELAKQAPMYFKKAIDEAEEEWGQHEMKKVIPTSGNLRHVIPENFSYFHVEFGLDQGFVHVIDDDSNFKSSFGLNVIRGMLRLPEEDMHRRRRPEPVEKQKQAVASFAREWEPFDWTRELD